MRFQPPSNPDYQPIPTGFQPSSQPPSNPCSSISPIPPEVGSRPRGAAPTQAKQAHDAVRREIRRGRLKRGACEICGVMHGEDGKIVDAHHEDYLLPLDVTWLCRQHHQQIHSIIRAGLWVKP